MTVFRDDDREPDGLDRIEVGEATEEDEKRRLLEGDLVALEVKFGNNCWGDEGVVAEAAASREPIELVFV